MEGGGRIIAASRARGALEQLLRVRAAQLAVGITAQHSGYLLHTRRAVEHRDVRRRHSALCRLRDDYMVVRAGGYLRQMRDCEHLVMFRDASKRVPHLESNLPANSRVNLVEHQ